MEDKVPTKIGSKIISVPKIRIGWVICHTREKMYLTKCYNNWQLGHLAQRRKREGDNLKLCMQYGEPGHIFRACTNDPKCFLFIENVHTE